MDSKTTKMTQSIHWRKPLFSCATQLFLNNQLIGKLKPGWSTSSASANIGNKHFRFRLRGFWQQSAEVVDAESHKVLAKIQFNCWYPKAVIRMNGKRFVWKFTSIWETRWALISESGEHIHHAGNVHRGQFQEPITDELQAITGLFIANYYRQLTTIIIAALLPLFLTAA